MKRPDVSLSTTRIEEMYFTKSTHWAHELEWRLFAPKERVSKRIDNGDFPICLFELPADAITEIVWGCRSSIQLKERLRKLPSEDQRLKHVSIMQAAINEVDYKLDITAIPEDWEPKKETETDIARFKRKILRIM